MSRKSFCVMMIFIFCFGLILMGCPKKTVVKEEPSVRKEEAAKLEAERVAKEAREREAREREAREREARERVEREREAREARERELAQKREEEARKEFERSLVAKKTPGVEGEVFESTLLKDIHFDYDKYDIRPGDAEILKKNAAILKPNPRVKIQIEGHCDERGTNEYNLALGERRSNSTKNYLISLGIEVGRVSTISYGEEKPLDHGHNEEAWNKNRRAHTIVTSK